MTMVGYVWLCMAMYVWLCMALHGSVNACIYHFNSSHFQWLLLLQNKSEC